MTDDNYYRQSPDWIRTTAQRWFEPKADEGIEPKPILQQAWQDRATGAIEWRDVETVIGE